MVSDWFLLLVCCILMAIIFFLLNIIYIRRMRSNMRMHEHKLLLKYQNLFDSMPIPYIQCQIIEDNGFIDVMVLDANQAFSDKIIPKSLIWHKNRKDIEKTAIGSIEKYLEVARKVLKTKEAYLTEFKINQCIYNIIITTSDEENVIDTFLIDITEQKNNRRNIERYNHKLLMAIDAADMIYWYYDIKNDLITIEMPETKPEPVTGELKKLLTKNKQVSLEEALLAVHVDYRPKVRYFFKQFIKGDIVKGRVEYQLSELRTFYRIEEVWEELVAEAEYDGDKNLIGMSGIFLPITEQKQLEQSLRDALNKAEEANKLKSSFLANISHEIRTPLNAIIGFSSMLPTAESDEEANEYLSIIRSNNGLLLQLIDDILDLAKIEAGTLDFSKTTFSVNDLMDQVIHSAKLGLDNDKVEMLCYKQEVDYQIHSCRNRIMQVLINLVNNSMKFTKEGSISVGYNYLPDENLLQFFVRDTGIGIPEDKQKEIFERFVKLDPFVQGSGLGLSICEMIIHTIGGDIWVESEIGKWTCFWFTVPYVMST